MSARTADMSFLRDPATLAFFERYEKTEEGTMEEKKRNASVAELTDDALDAVDGGIKRVQGMARSTWCSACGMEDAGIV